MSQPIPRESYPSHLLYHCKTKSLTSSPSLPYLHFHRNDFSPFCSLGIEALPYCSFNLVHESTRPPSFSLRIPGPLLPVHKTHRPQ
ncbi:hypothetical protein V6Z11_A07G181300 [Gossypium hirsutum]